ncbi:MAG: class I SAM-dependent methyltransferase [Actinomycetota bacterium]|nr:class I SAM-dependent methyltransferase [Actinomycetota bacterium]
MSHSEEQLDAFAHWERQAWETRAGPYAETMAALTAGAAEALLDAAEVTVGTRVLDVATGPGVVAAAARGRGADVVAVDQAEAMVSLARAAGLDARQARAEQLPFDDGAFDAVVAGFLLNHMARPEEGVGELARVCRVRVALSVWDVPDANPALGLFGSAAASFQMPDTVPPGPDSHLYAEDGRLRALLAHAGLVEVRVVRVSWTLTVEPGAWFDAAAASLPRTGAVLAAASADQRASIRARYVEMVSDSYGGAGGLVTLPAAAVVGSGRSASPRPR